jgi:hypothetical protein
MRISFLVSWGGVRLSPLGIWPLFGLLYQSQMMMMMSVEQLWNENWQGKPKYSEKTYPSATLSTTNPTWSDLGLNLGHHSGKPVANHLSYDTTFMSVSFHLFLVYGQLFPFLLEFFPFYVCSCMRSLWSLVSSHSLFLVSSFLSSRFPVTSWTILFCVIS